ncbi:hypothetical protein QWA68_010615 [Fusarium oxysporum]|nr:hypothetical protein QWA68_010615 [Fusarium oxysporum]
MKRLHTRTKHSAQGSNPVPEASGASQLVHSGASTGQPKPVVETPVLGLIQLWPDPDLESASHIQTEVDLVAIHGLGGHAYKTWREGEKLWLRDFLPHDVPTARVLTFGYNAGVAFTQSKSNIRDFATSLLEGIRTFRRRNKEADRKMIFVCHSLGGIVFKQALVIAHEKETRYGSIKEAVAGVIFLGTPHRGADIAYWSKLLAKFANVLTAGKMREDLLKALAPKSTELGTICSQFVERGMRLQIFSLYERHETSGLGSLVVDEFSAILHLPNETPIPMEADHRGLCKYLTPSDSCYRTVFNCIEELMDSLIETSEQPYFDSSQREFLSKLRAVDHDTVLSKIPGGWTRSSRWFLELPEFKSWRVLQGQQTLWLYGVPGSGKTVLMKSIVEFLNSQSDIASSPVIWKPISFFFDDKDPERKTSDSFIRSVLDQILGDSRCASVIRYLDFDPSKIPDTEKSLWECFQTIVKRSRGIIFQLVIDAMDEALRHNENPPTIVDKLRDLVESDASGRVRMLLSHREQPPYGFPQRTDAAVISIDNENTRKNVDEFVQMKVRSSLQESKLSLSMASTIEAKIVKKAQGNFLFATLAWKQFSNGTVQWTRDKIKASLTGLDKTSDDLVDFYCQLLSNISSRYRQKAKIAFTILRLCKESISPTQLATMAVMVDMEGIEQDEDLEELKAQAADFEEYLVQACEYMVKIDNNSVQFVHVSVKDMLSMSLGMHSPRNQSIISELTVSNSEGQSIMLNICLKTMHLERRSPESWLETYGAMTEALRSLRETFSGLVPNHEQLTQIDELTNSHVDSMSKTSCLAYAVRNWFQHYKEASPSVEQDVKIINFLSTINGCLCYLLWYQLPTKDDGGKMPYLSRYPAAHLPLESSRTMTLFRVIALGDLPRLVGAILRRGVNINYLAGTVTPLSWSIICRRRDSFQALLESSEIEVNYHAYRQRASIHHAASCIEDTFYMERLLEFTNIDVNAVGDNGTPLHVAISSKNIQGADKLLNHPRVNIYFKADMEESPYSMAFRHKIWEPFLLRILDMTEKPKPPSTRQAYGTSQLLWAGVHGWTNMEERILREDHNQVFLVDQESRMNALAHYAYFGRKEKLAWIIDRLPTHGLLLRGASDRYDLLHLCASQDWEDMVHLLQRKYKLKSLKFDHQGRNMLHWIMEHGWDLDRFDLSCYSVSDLNSQDRDGLTPMHIAASNRNIHALEVLVISGADPYLKDKRGMSPAHLAAQVGWRKGVEYLTDTSHRELGRTRDGATLLHLVAIWFEGSLVSKLLCSRQGMTNARDGNRRTPLHYASINDNASAMIALLDAGGEINARDENGMTPLHEAIRCLSVKTARLLLKRGADFKAIDGFGQTCLHLSVRYKHNYLLKKFIKIGLAANAYDKFGMSPLHRACSTGVSEHVQMLLEKGASYKARNTHQRSPLDIAVHRENVKAIEVLISWLDHAAKRGDKKPRRSRTRQELLDQALLLAYQFGCEKASARLRSAGAKADKSTISVRQVYMDGPSPESRWPLKPYKSQARSAINKEL